MTVTTRKQWRNKKITRTEKKDSKSAWLLYGIGIGILVACIAIFGIGSLIFFALSSDSNLTVTNTSTPTTTRSSPMHEPVTTAGEDGMTLVYVSAGEFQMGNTAEDTVAACQALWEQGECKLDSYKESEPPHTVNLKAFWIDQTEVTNDMFAAFLNAEGNQSEENVTWLREEDSDVLIHQVGGTWQADSGYEDHPVIEVTWYGAKSYCEWAGRCLPSEAEWEKAARSGLEGKDFPWGDDAPVCKKGADNGAQFGGCLSRTESVGSFAPNGYGVYDMAGNVSEWVEDWFDVYPGGDENAERFFGQTYRVHRGGSWNHGAFGNLISLRGENDQTYGRDFVGFRCAMDAE